MKKSSLSLLVFAAYMAALSASFLLFPNPFITLFGFDETHEVWIRIAGYLLGVLAFFYVMAVREAAAAFYRWTVQARLLTLPLFLSFVLLDIAPPVLLLFGLIDAVSAIWTLLTLRYERKEAM